jgi:hypothetical protein
MKWVVLGLLVPFAAICFYAYSKRKPQISKPRKIATPRSTFPAVEKWSYDHSKKFNATDVVFQQMTLINEKSKKSKQKYYSELYPVLFENPTPVVQKLPAWEKFTLEFLAQHAKTLHKVKKQGNNRRFINYDKSKPIQIESYDHEELSMSARELFANLSNPRADHYYYSGIIQMLGETISKEFVPYSTEFDVTGGDKSSNIWFGGRGSNMRAHYDAMHNFHVQIQGQNRFLLYPPSHWRYLYLHPRLHASHRYSQVNPDDYNRKEYPLYEFANKISDSGPFEVTLEEGNILYVPPYWIHEVESVGPKISIAVNVWTDSEENEAFELFMRAPLPFEDNWTPAQKRFGVRQFIKRTLNRYLTRVKDNEPQRLVYQYESVRDYINKVLIDARYGPLFFDDMLPVEGNVDDFCAFEQEIRDLEDKFKKYGEGIVDLALVLPPGFRDIVFGNYIEEIVAWAVDPGYVGVFLKNCF